MDKIENWIYIIGSILYFLYSLRRKKPPVTRQPEASPEALPESAPTPRRQVLRRRVSNPSEMRTPDQARAEKARQRMEEVFDEYDEDETIEEGYREDPAVDKKMKDDQQDSPVLQEWKARQQELEERKQAAERRYQALAQESIRSGLATQYAERTELRRRAPKGSRYRRLLGTPQGARQAFVLTEIFSRKYQ